MDKVFLILLFCWFSQFCNAQRKGFFEKKNMTIVKNGPYFGLQKGKFIIAELGGERQWKELQFRKPKTHAVNIGLNYDFTNNVLGYDLGYWYKSTNVGFTFGGSLLLRTDFNNTRIGFTPVIGYKIWQLHAQTGYQLLSNKPATSFEANNLFISLRFVLINNTKIKK